MDNIVIGFAGPIGSGKSTLSRLVSRKLRWPLASFGTYVRKAAQVYGFDKSRKGLQLTGDFLINRGWKSFCEEVLADANWRPGSNLIIEGIRHIEAIKMLENIMTPAQIFLIYVSLGDPERKIRLKASNNEEYLKLEEIELHPTEQQVRTALFDRANFVVDNSRPVDKVVEEIVSWVGSL